MQNKFWVTTFAVIVTVLSVFYLSFTFMANHMETKARNYATETGNTKTAFMDSLWNEEVYHLGFKSYTLKEVKERALNLGLDLQGGMHVTLEVTPADILISLAGGNPTVEFKNAIAKAKEVQKNSQDRFTDIFFDAFEEANPDKPLAEIFASSANKDLIDFGSSNSDVRKAILSEVDGAIDLAQKVIETRVDQFGVTQPSIQRIQGTGRIQIELPGVDNPARVRTLLQGVAQLEFLEVATADIYVPVISKIDEFLYAEEQANLGTVEKDTNLIGEGDVVEPADGNEGEDALFAEDSNNVEDSDSTKLEEAKISGFLKMLKSRQGLVFSALDTSRVNAYLNRADVKRLIPANLKFLWEHKATITDGKEFLQLYPIKTERGGRAPLTGEIIADARQDVDEYGRAVVSMNMQPQAGRVWAKLTAALAQKGLQNGVPSQVAIVLDNRIYSAPTVQTEISGGRSQISGNFTVEEAKDLANILKAGKLPAPTRIVEEAVVGPTLGLEAQRSGLISIACGLIIVVLFMIGYYSKGGLVANIALVFNLFFIIGILSNLGAALTLPGIAGIVLTIGMSIDANVLVFERIREEMRVSKNMAQAINTGYDKAFWTIFDANVTTFLIGIFLYVFGSGPIKGFAITLMIGIACSFFTAVYITRVIISWMTKDGQKDNVSFQTPFSKNFLTNINFDFLGKRKMAYVGSAIVILIGWSLIAMQGLNLGVDLQGGRSYQVKFAEELPASQVKVALASSFKNKGLEVKTFGDDKTLKITTNYLVEDESAEADKKVRMALVTGLEKFTADKFTAAKFTDVDRNPNEGEFTVPSYSKVGATIADDIKDSSSKSVFFSLAAIFLYIWVRFRKWRFGLGAVIALFHDTLMVFSIFAIARALGVAYEIDQVFVAAMLTIIGYSINDTVVVFDRVREYLGIQGANNLKHTFNQSINNTMSRTIVTSVTTLLVVLVLFLFGGEVLRGFSFALLIGIVIGTYSSVFIATPVVYDTISMTQNKKEVAIEKATA
ncbi:MAG: SecD/SecF fusion protein [Bacteroidia bacterium]|jgi:SecD/SecF fusion protein